MLNSTLFRNGSLSRLSLVMLAIVVSACTAVQAVACDNENADGRRIVRGGDSGVDSEVLVQVARLSEQIEALQAELDDVRAVLADIGGPEYGVVARVPRGPNAFVMPAMPPMPPMPQPDWPAEMDNREARAEWREEMREWKKEFAGEWRELAHEWKEQQRELKDEWRERSRDFRAHAHEMAGVAREHAGRARKMAERVAREHSGGRHRGSANSTQVARVVYLVEGEHAEQLYDLLAPSDVRVIVSREGEHVAVRGTQDEQKVLVAGLQLLGWIDRDEVFESMGEGNRVDRKYKVGKKRAKRLFGMLAPDDVRVVVSRAGDGAVIVSGTKHEQKALRAFLELLRW